VGFNILGSNNFNTWLDVQAVDINVKVIKLGYSFPPNGFKSFSGDDFLVMQKGEHLFYGN